MGLFGPSKKFSEMQTAEQQYRASGSYEGTAQATRDASADRTARYHRDRRREQAQIDTDNRRKQVVQAGGMHVVNGNVVLDDRWRLATDKLPTGNLKDYVFHDKLGDLTVKDLHDLADNHGPNCRCGLGR